MLQPKPEIFNDMGVTEEILQKVSSGQDVLLVEFKALRDSHGQLAEEFQIHRRDDREDFKRVFETMEANRKNGADQFAKIIETLLRRMDSQDQTVKELSKLVDSNNAAQDRAKGAGWVIVGVITFLGAALLAVINHLWK